MPTTIFQSTPPVKAATISGVKTHSRHEISIHAAREGGDSGCFAAASRVAISIHAAREGGDINTLNPNQSSPVFQSTPPVKAATFTHYKSSVIVRISIHAAREGGDRKKSNNTANNSISIHAAREGGDCGNE